MFATVCLWALSWARLIQSTSSPSIYFTSTYLRSILMSSSNFLPGLPRRLCPSHFSTTILYVLLIFPVRSTCDTHHTILDFIILIIFGEEHTNQDFNQCFSESSVCFLPLRYKYCHENCSQTRKALNFFCSYIALSNFGVCKQVDWDDVYSKYA